MAVDYNSRTSAHPFPRSKRAVVVCMRNEAVFLLEWVAYHLSVGFDRIFLVTNNCQDGTDLMADRLAELEPVIHIRNEVAPGEAPQVVGLARALQHPAMADVEWLLHIDADEFLNITTGAGMVGDLQPVAQNMRAAAGRGYSTATDLADWLVRELKMPFRDAHHVTGTIVKLAETKGCDLDALSLDEMQKVEPRITKAVFSVLSVENSVKSRTSYGGTAPQNVTKMARAWLKKLEKDRGKV